MNLIIYHTYCCDAESHDAVICLQYESKESFLRDFEEKLRICMKELEVFKKQQDEWYATAGKTVGSKGNARIELHREWLATKPVVPSGSFKIAGRSFSAYDFCDHTSSQVFGTSYPNKITSMPKVYELQEWFEANLPA